MLSLTVLLIGIYDLFSGNFIERETYNCFSSTIANTGHVNKTSFLRCIDEQNIRSDRISNGLLALLIIFAIISTMMYLKPYLAPYFPSNKKSNDTAKK